MSREQTDHEFMSVLQRHSPATIQTLCDVIGITVTAVRQKLMRLQSLGWVSRTVSRQERGRPCHTYQLTSKGIQELGDDHAEMAAILWKQVMLISNSEVREQVLAGIKSSMVERFGACRSGSDLTNRLQLLTSSLAEQGFDLEVSTDEATSSLPILREFNCPYHELAAEDASICNLEQSVFSELLGVPVELSSCQLEGHRCCEFQIGEEIPAGT